MGRIDIVVNNAGILDERRWEKEISVNIVSITYSKREIISTLFTLIIFTSNNFKGGMIMTAMLAMDHMGQHNNGQGGILVNVSQHVNFACSAQLPVYIATKHAVIGLSQSLSVSKILL